PKNEICKYPQFLPDGRHFLYVGEGSGPSRRGIYWASLDGKERKLVLNEDNRAVYGSGFLLYLRDTTLMAQAFDPRQGQLKGEPHEVAEPVANNEYARGIFDLSENGIL